MDKELEAEAAALLALDEKRTPGEWYVWQSGVGPTQVRCPVASIPPTYATPAYSLESRNASFIAAAPRMATLIRNLLAALRDAERYRWLREHADARFDCGGYVLSFDNWLNYPRVIAEDGPADPQGVDEAIDAALVTGDKQT